MATTPMAIGLERAVRCVAPIRRIGRAALIAAVLAGAVGCGKPNDGAPAATPAAAPATPDAARPAQPNGAGSGAGAESGGASAGANRAPGAGGEPQGGGPPVSVTTVRAERRDMPIGLEATGTVVAVSSVDVKPQVSSVVTAVHVREGQFVKAGDPLFTLDARADQANVAKLVAQQSRDEATLADLKRQLARNQELVERGFVSSASADAIRAQVDAQAAAVAADRAAIEAARVPVGYARIVSPSAGRVGTVGAWQGAAVVANQTTLVTVTRIDPIDVAFPVPQRHLQDLLAALDGGRAPVTAALPDGTKSLTGKLVFVDNAVDAQSGTVKVKARFDNRESLLWPGAFVRASLDFGEVSDAVVVPQAAIIRGPRGAFVYVVVDGRAQQRTVEVLASRGDDAAVRGVAAGDAVVLDGRQNLRPGAPVAEQSSGPGRGEGFARAEPTPQERMR